MIDRKLGAMPKPDLEVIDQYLRWSLGLKLAPKYILISSKPGPWLTPHTLESTLIRLAKLTFLATIKDSRPLFYKL